MTDELMTVAEVEALLEGNGFDNSHLLRNAPRLATALVAALGQRDEAIDIMRRTLAGHAYSQDMRAFLAAHSGHPIGDPE